MTAPDPIFADPRLAVLYDAFDGPRDDLDAYVALAEDDGARRVVDLGAGTGSLALRLAVPGRTVIAVDPAGASLDVARTKPGAERVTWIEGDATAIPADVRADLVVMTGNAAQAVVADVAWTTLLGRVRAALAPGGRVVFESRRPERRAWEDWEGTCATLDLPGLGSVEQRLALTAVDGPLVSFRVTYRFADGTVLVSDSTLRFRAREELEADLRAAGLVVDDVRDAPDRPGRELVMIARRP